MCVWVILKIIHFIHLCYIYIILEWIMNFSSLKVGIIICKELLTFNFDVLIFILKQGIMKKLVHKYFLRRLTSYCSLPLLMHIIVYLDHIFSSKFTSLVVTCQLTNIGWNINVKLKVTTTWTVFPCWYFYDILIFSDDLWVCENILKFKNTHDSYTNLSA